MHSGSQGYCNPGWQPEYFGALCPRINLGHPPICTIKLSQFTERQTTSHTETHTYGQYRVAIEPNVNYLHTLEWICSTWKEPRLKQAEHANLHIELNLWPHCYKAAMLNAAPHVIYTVLCAVVYLIIGWLYLKWLIWLTIIRYFSALFFL